jgi:hypothetical protein
MAIPGGGSFDLLLSSYTFKQEEANFLRHQSAEWGKRSDPAEVPDHFKTYSADDKSRYRKDHMYEEKR